MEETSPAIALILAQAPAFFTVAGRLAGLFLFSPLLSSLMIPARIKAITVILLATCVYPLLPPGFGALTPDVFSLIGLIVAEAMVGYVVGVVAAIPILSLEMSGVIAGQQMGLGLARIYNPESDSEVDVLGQMLYFVALAGLVVGGGVDRLLGCVIHSFSTIQPGALTATVAPLDLLVQTISAGFELAIRITTPVSAGVLLMTITLGAVGKTMPQLNIMTVGFTFKIVIGLLALIASLAAIAATCGDVMQSTFISIENWVQQPLPSPSPLATQSGQVNGG